MFACLFLLVFVSLFVCLNMQNVVTLPRFKQGVNESRMSRKLHFDKIALFNLVKPASVSKLTLRKKSELRGFKNFNKEELYSQPLMLVQSELLGPKKSRIHKRA